MNPRGVEGTEKEQEMRYHAALKNPEITVIKGELRGSSCKRMNFQQAKLSGIDLKGANLSGINLQNADLTGAELNEVASSGQLIFVAGQIAMDLRLNGIVYQNTLEA